ncbi:MAG TPA: hypothetical protein VGL22_16775 [Terracidiphilus sp.]|jgi:hypothetical protein
MNELDVEALRAAFRDGLTACLEECAHGRRGLFAEHEHLGEEHAWPEAGRLRELAAALQSILSQNEENDSLVDEFLDLCTIHGEYDPGEARLAREFMKRMDRGQVGTPTQKEQPWS